MDRHVVYCAARAWHSPGEVCRQALVPESMPGRADAMVGWDEAERVWDAALALTADPLLGMHLACRGMGSPRAWRWSYWMFQATF